MLPWPEAAAMKDRCCSGTLETEHLETILDQVDFEIRRENYDSEQAMKVVDRICRNNPALFLNLWPYALAALVDARIKAIEPPKAKQGPAKKRPGRGRARQPVSRRSRTM
jgi:hypothetical protein